MGRLRLHERVRLVKRVVERLLGLERLWVRDWVGQSRANGRDRVTKVEGGVVELLLLLLMSVKRYRLCKVRQLLLRMRVGDGECFG